MKGLILCGGLSTRMQQDKSNIAYHGVPQWQYLYNLVQSFMPEVYISCRKDQQFPDDIPLIRDSVTGSGPSTGILSAHAAFPESAWLVLACDLPLISEQSLRLLLSARDPAKNATSFISDFNDSPEPLIAIWEPSGLELLQERVTAGMNCPRKTLLQADIVLLKNPHAAEQFNANTPEEMQSAKEQLG